MVGCEYKQGITKTTISLNELVNVLQVDYLVPINTYDKRILIEEYCDIIVDNSGTHESLIDVKKILVALNMWNDDDVYVKNAMQNTTQGRESLNELEYAKYSKRAVF